MPDRGFTYSEEYRLACLARYIVAMPTSGKRAKFLDDMEKLHGSAAIDPVRELVRAEWKRRREDLSEGVNAKQPSLF